MRNFQQIASGLDVGPLLNAIQRKPQLWNQYGVRTWHPESVHRVIDDIVLRYNSFDGREPPIGDDFVEAVCSRLECVNYPPWNELPEVAGLIFPLMFRVQGLHLGRVFISRMRPGTVIPAHSDRIAPAEEQFPSRMPPAVYYDRYHIVLASSPGVIFKCGDEQISMQKGEAWYFNNQLLHEVVNNSADDRIHLIADIHSAQGIYYPPVARPKAKEPENADLRA